MTHKYRIAYKWKRYTKFTQKSHISIEKRRRFFRLRLDFELNRFINSRQSILVCSSDFVNILKLTLTHIFCYFHWHSFIVYSFWVWIYATNCSEATQFRNLNKTNIWRLIHSLIITMKLVIAMITDTLIIAAIITTGFEYTHTHINVIS